MYILQVIGTGARTLSSENISALVRILYTIYAPQYLSPPLVLWHFVGLVSINKQQQLVVVLPAVAEQLYRGGLHSPVSDPIDKRSQDADPRGFHFRVRVYLPHHHREVKRRRAQFSTTWFTKCFAGYGKIQDRQSPRNF